MALRSDQLCTSTLVVGEVLAGARMIGNAELERTYRDFFDDPNWQLLAFTASTIECFVAARALPGVKAPDAVHLACAAEAGVDVFLTHDRKLQGRHLPGIGFIVDLDTDIFGPRDDPDAP